MSIFGRLPLGTFEDLEVDTCPKGQQNLGGACVLFDMLSQCPGGEDLDIETGRCIVQPTVSAIPTKTFRLARPQLPLPTVSVGPSIQLISRSGQIGGGCGVGQKLVNGTCVDMALVPLPQGGAEARLHSAALEDLTLGKAVPWILGGLALGILAVKFLVPKKGVQPNWRRKVKRNSPGWPKWMRDQEREELRRLLVSRKYSPAKAAWYARLLEADGMGPEELKEYLKIPAGEVGSLERSYGYTKNGRKARGNSRSVSPTIRRIKRSESAAAQAKRLFLEQKDKDLWAYYEGDISLRDLLDWNPPKQIRQHFDRMLLDWVAIE